MTMTTTIKAAGSPSVIDREQQIADPAPLGLGAFALTTFVLSAANAGWIPKGGDTVVVGLASAYGGLAQFCAGMWEFKRNNTFGATALSRPVLTVFVLLTTTYLVLAIGSFTSQVGLTVFGGYLGILTALAAWYASAKGIWAATLTSRRAP